VAIGYSSLSGAAGSSAVVVGSPDSGGGVVVVVGVGTTGVGFGRFGDGV